MTPDEIYQTKVDKYIEHRFGIPVVRGSGKLDIENDPGYAYSEYTFQDPSTKFVISFSSEEAKTKSGSDLEYNGYQWREGEGHFNYKITYDQGEWFRVLHDLIVLEL